MTSAATPSEFRRVPPGGALRTTRLIAMLGPGDPARVNAAADTLAGNGIRALAVGLAGPGALAAASTLAARLPAECDVGLAAVATPDDVVRAAEAGARFIMAPYLAAEVIHTARHRGVASYPGALTPAEIHLAWRAGASAVQLFPAGPLGPGHLAAVREQLPEIPLIAAGGIGCPDVAGWLEAGAAAVALGGALLGDALSPGGDLAALADRTRRVCAAAAQVP